MRVKFGFRMPSISKRRAAFKSGLPGGKRYWRNKVGVKMPKNTGWVTDPEKFIYNKVYRRTTKSVVPDGLFFDKPRSATKGSKQTAKIIQPAKIVQPARIMETPDERSDLTPRLDQGPVFAVLLLAGICIFLFVVVSGSSHP